MQPIWLSVVLALLSAAPADRTERIPVRRIPAAEALERLLQSSLPRDVEARSGERPAGAALPRGLVALSVDPATNALVVTGDPAALRQVRRMVELVDLAPRPLRLSLCFIRPDREALAGVPLQNAGEAELGGEPVPPFDTAVLEEEPARALLSRSREAGRVVATAEPVTGSDRPVWCFVPDPASRRVETITVTPRLNGDNSVTVIVRSRRGRVVAVGRIPAGRALLLAPASGNLLLIRAEAPAPGP